MPAAFTLRIDPATAVAIETMRQIVARPEDSSHGYGPHITLAIYPDEVHRDRLRETFAQLAASWRALPVTLCGLGVFPGPPPVLWLAPVVTADLLSRHAQLCTALRTEQNHPHFRPGHWVPHVTLLNSALCLERAVAALLAGWRPVTGMLDWVDLVRFHPIDVLESRALPHDAPGSSTP